MTGGTPKPQADKFDEELSKNAALNYSKAYCRSVFADGYADSFLAGARWQHSQDRQAREELEREVAAYKEIEQVQWTTQAILQKKIAALESEVVMWQGLESQKHMEHNARMAERDVARSELKEERERAKGLVEALEMYKDVECKHPVGHFKTVTYGYLAEEALTKYRSTKSEGK